MATVILGVLGAGLGAVIAGPAGALKGAELGWAIGTTIGGVIESDKKYPTQTYGRLSDLRVTSSAYGTVIPRVWGKVQLSGNVMWATPLAEHENDYHSGGGGGSGGGGQTTQVYTYTVSLALAVAKGGRLGSSSLKRIYADDQVYYDSSRGSNANVRWYPGTNSQNADPLMTATYGADAPAYRNTAYIMLQDMPLGDFGNRIPNLSVELDTGTITLDQLVSDVCGFVGLTATDLDVTQGAGTQVTGIIMNSRIDAKNALQPILAAYAFDMIDVDGVLRLVQRGGPPVAQINWGDMGATTGGTGTGEAASRIQKKRGMEWELPKRVDVTYYSLVNSFQQASQGAVRQAVQSSKFVTVSLPMSMTDDVARNIAERELYLAWIERNSYVTSVLPSFTFLSPADPVMVDTDGTGRLVRCRIDDMETGVVGEIRLTLVPDDASVYSQSYSGSPPVSISAPPTNVPTTFFAWGGREIQDVDLGRPGIYVAATGDVGWRGCSIYVSIDAGATYMLSGRVSQRSVMGGCGAVAALGTLNGAGFDVSTTTNVSLLFGASLTSSSEASAKSGQGNYGLITSISQSASNVANYELIAFAAASISSGSIYSISDMLRGQRGTSSAAHVAGGQFVRLDNSIVRVPLTNQSVGTTVLVKCLSGYQTLSDVSPQTVFVSASTPTADQQSIATISSQVTGLAAVKAVPFWRVKGYINSQRAQSDRIDATYFDTGIHVPTGTVQFAWTEFATGPGGSLIRDSNANWSMWGRLGIQNTGASAATVNIGIPYVDNYTKIIWSGPSAATKISWSWTAGAGAAPDTYNLYRGTATGTETLYASGITSTSFLDTSVINGTTYYAYVTEVRGGIESAHSAEVSILASPTTMTTTTLFDKNTNDGSLTNNSVTLSVPVGVTGILSFFFFNEQSTSVDSGSNPSTLYILMDAFTQVGMMFVDAGT